MNKNDNNCIGTNFNSILWIKKLWTTKILHNFIFLEYYCKKISVYKQCCWLDDDSLNKLGFLKLRIKVVLLNRHCNIVPHTARLFLSAHIVLISVSFLLTIYLYILFFLNKTFSIIFGSACAQIHSISGMSLLSLWKIIEIKILSS